MRCAAKRVRARPQLLSPPASQAYLHSELHKKDWVGAVGPHCDGPPLVFDMPLAPIAVAVQQRPTPSPPRETPAHSRPLPVLATAQEPAQKIHHFVIFKLPELTDHSYTFQMMAATVAKFNDLPGMQVAFTAAGAPGMNLAQTLEVLEWPDKTAGFTHCLLCIADDVRAPRSDRLVP